MIGFIARGSSLAPAMVATTQTVPSMMRPIIPAMMDAAEKLTLPPKTEMHSSDSLSQLLPHGTFLQTQASMSLSGEKTILTYYT